MSSRTRVQVFATALLALLLVGSGVLATELSASAGRAQLTYADRAEDGDPPQVALGIAMGAFRGLFVNVLWIRANELKEAGQFHEANNLSRAITALQPRFPRVWAFHAWNMAYNISVSTQTPQERWEWVNKGIRLIRDEGLIYNPNDMLLHKELAWILFHKVGGYTDDSNNYYKRAFAAEWTAVLGPPPRPSPDIRSRDAAIEAYKQWIGNIAEAPASVEALYEEVPRLQELVGILRGELGLDLDMGLLERYEQGIAMARSPRRAVFLEEMDSTATRVQDLVADPELEDAWQGLLRVVRKRVLVDEYHMEPRRMVRYMDRFGPVDYRLPAAHSLYWAARGSEEAGRVATSTTVEDMDIVNLDRLIVQSVQEVYRQGELYFDLLDFFERREAGLYIPMPNVHFVRTYGDILDGLRERAGIFESRSRAYTLYSAGYENFIQDAIRLFYRRGEIARAEAWYERLRTWDDQNTNNLSSDYALPLNEFIDEQFKDNRYTSPQVAISEIYAALQGAFLNGLLNDQPELFESQLAYARRFHAGYMAEQRRMTTASGNIGRMELIPADFQFVAGSVFAQTIQILGLDDAEYMYSQAPRGLKLYAYPTIEQWFSGAIELLEASGGRSLVEVFPPPEGLEEFRLRFEEQLRERQRQLNPQLQ
ncbi:MAG: hypothetical protein AAGG07_11600 [Planctomycetota bacterium]